MKSMLRWPLRGAALGLLATTTLGCYVKVDAESAVIWEGTPKTLTGAYVAGKDLLVDSSNGSVTVLPGGSPTEISATFQPFSIRANSEEELAKNDMKNDLVLEVDDTGDPIVVRVARVSGASGMLGAHVEVALPAGFNGGIDVEPSNGNADVDLTGGDPAYTTVNCVNGSPLGWM